MTQSQLMDVTERDGKRTYQFYSDGHKLDIEVTVSVEDADRF